MLRLKYKTALNPDFSLEPNAKRRYLCHVGSKLGAVPYKYVNMIKETGEI